ncbi:MAG: leucine-rich repeat domain-containing protein, partial [Odoribacter sp.]|nr:leucine-rich repeat domain-containing protein [Odoribacter sp.]
YLSGCTSLTHLNCGNNNLTSLDVSKNTALTRLYCYSNNLSATALNKIFNDLPQRTSELNISYNPGSNTCDTSIAKNKGWGVLNFNSSK